VVSRHHRRKLLARAPQALPRRLAASELALIPHGEGHWLRSEPDAPTPSIFELEREQLGERYEILRHGGGGEGIDMVCGAVRFDHPVARKLLAVLPRILTLDPATSPMQLEWLRSTLRLMALEAEGLRPGGETMITRLSDVLVVQALRAWLESDPAAQSGWLGALRDPRDRPRDLAHPPRARPPVDPRLPALADRFGYRSEAAFARAFKRVIGTPPGAVRRAGPVESIAA
jgi:AraC-like DNA-binding protein